MARGKDFVEWCVSVKKYFVVNIIRKKYMKPDNNIPYIFLKKILLKIFIHRVLRIKIRVTHVCMFVLCPTIFDFRELLELGTFWKISLSPHFPHTHYPFTIQHKNNLHLYHFGFHLDLSKF